jgi:D-methionine transport system permease protein
MSIEISLYTEALGETIYMTLAATFMVFILGLLLGSILYRVHEDGLAPNRITYAILSGITTTLRSIPFLILLVLLIPFTRILLQTILGPSAALPALTIGGTPFYARIVELALLEKGKYLKETGFAFGAKLHQVMSRILIPESLPALVRGITVTGVTIAGYTSIAGAIGAGGLGNLAYLYGYARNRQDVTIIATILMVLFILLLQYGGDRLTKKLSHK